MLETACDQAITPQMVKCLAATARERIRRMPGALEQWRRDPNHPLKWRYVDGRPLYRVDAVRDYLTRRDRTTRTPQPHNAHGDARGARP
jgi:hypothetical protein